MKQDRIYERRSRLDRRARVLQDNFSDVCRLADAILIDAAMRNGGIGATRFDGRSIAASIPDAAPWGEWLAALKRSVDASDHGIVPPCPPLPRVPKWFASSPGRAALMAKVGAIYED